MKRPIPVFLGVALVVALACGRAPDASATSMLAQNVVDLIDLSERILVGDVVSLDDGERQRDGLPAHWSVLHAGASSPTNARN